MAGIGTGRPAGVGGPFDRTAPRALVVGAGPAGMRAALDLADLGVWVVLVDRAPTTGGTLTRLDVQYPTIDCGACRMLESVSGPPWPERRCLRTGISHPLVEVLSSTSLERLEAVGEGFEVSVRVGGRWIDPGLCVGCGACAEVCPVTVPDEHDCGLVQRKAVFRPHPWAQPAAFVIDEAACTLCGDCVGGCPSGAIELERPPDEREMRVGAVVLATGFAGFDPALQPQWGWGRHPDVMTGLELERWIAPLVCSGGALRRRSDGSKAERVAFVQCVGSRDERHPYCSSICCMHAVKEAILLKERLGVSEAHVYAIDLRAVGAGYEQTLGRALAAGVRIVHARPGAVELGERPLLRVEQPPHGQRLEPYDLVVLSVGMVPSPGTDRLAALAGVELDEHGFVRTGADGMASTSRPGLFACGGATGPCDIPASVVGAAEAAMLAASHLGVPSRRAPVAFDPSPPFAELHRPARLPPMPAGPTVPDRGLELPGPEQVPVADRALVLGAGPAGLASALAIAEAGHDVTLVEREARPGGTLLRLASRLGGTDPAALLEDLEARLAASGRIELLTETELVSHRGGPGAYVSVLRDRRTAADRTVRHGAMVVATGARELVPRGTLLHGEHPAVLTGLELEERLRSGRPLGGDRPVVVMVQCVGSRTAERPSCSRVCCQQAVKNGLAILRGHPGARVVVLHRDVRTVGFDELFYEEARRAGVLFVRLEEDRPPSVEAHGERVIVRFYDPLAARLVRIEADLLVLSAAAVPRLSEEPELAARLGLQLGPAGHAAVASEKFRPVEALRRGLLVAGMAAGPVLAREAMAQGRAAAARAVSVLSRERLEARPGAVALRARWCASCGLCVEVCPAGAREIEEGRGAVVHAGLCQGCGACVVACPSGTTDQPGLDDRAVLSMIDDSLEVRS